MKKLITSWSQPNHASVYNHSFPVPVTFLQYFTNFWRKNNTKQRTTTKTKQKQKQKRN